jgi:alpha-ketoglutarate-dependent taurine dioxygenase
VRRGLSGYRAGAAGASVIEQALLEHLAIVIADLEDDLDWLLDVGRRFGPLTPHILTRFHHPKTAEMSIITANMDNAESRETARPAGAFWHSDLSYCRDPSDAIFLYATHVPSDGGDTLIANMQLAYAGYTVCINGVPGDESDAILAELFEHMQAPEFCYRHHWAGGQLVGIDNRATLHCAMADYHRPMRKLRMIVGCTERATPGVGNLLT